MSLGTGVLGVSYIDRNLCIQSRNVGSTFPFTDSPNIMRHEIAHQLGIHYECSNLGCRENPEYSVLIGASGWCADCDAILRASDGFHWKHVCDVNTASGDRKIDIQDLAKLGANFGSNRGDSRWLERCDINNDGKIDIHEVAMTAKNFGWVFDRYPFS